MPTVSARVIAPIVVSAAVAAVAMWASAPYAVGVFHDDGVYAILARSLAETGEYRYLHIPGAPMATHYPPAYPALLSLLWRIDPPFPGNIGGLLIANCVLLALTAWGTMRFATRVLGWSDVAAAVGASIATLSYPLLFLSRALLSEPLFAAMLLPSLLLAERATRTGSRPANAALAGAMAGVLMLVRTHAIALVAAVLLVAALRRRWRIAMIYAAAALVVILPWQLWVAVHDGAIADPLRGSYGSYASWWLAGVRDGGIAFLWSVASTNAREIGAFLADRSALADTSLPRTIASVLFSAAVAVGAWRAWPSAPVMVAFGAAYFAIVLVWPYSPFRFLFAVWPVLILAAGEAAKLAVSARRRGLVLGLAALAPLLMVAAGAVRSEYRAYATRAWDQPAAAATSQIAPLVRWITANTASEDIVAVDGEQLVYLFTGRQAVPVVSFTAAEYVKPRDAAAMSASILEMLEHVPATVVGTIQPVLFRAAEKLAADSARGGASLAPLQRFGGGGVFRVERR